MDKLFKRGEELDRPVSELKWMAEFLASRGQTQKALEIYRALVETMIDERAAGQKEKQFPPENKKAA